MASTQSPVAIIAAPQKDQLVEHEGKRYKTVKEGLAYILIPPNAKTSQDPQAEAKAKAKADDGGEQAQTVFYNPIQQFNRDLSVLAIRAFGEDLCQRRRLKHEALGGKIAQKKENKRQKRKRQREEDVGEEEDGGVKLRKVEDGSAVQAKNGIDGQAAAGGGISGAREEEVEEGGVSVNIPEDADAAEMIGEAAHNDVVQTGAASGARNEDIEDGVVSATEPGNANTRNAAEQVASKEVPPDHQTLPNGSTAGTAPEQPWQPRFRILDALSATGLRALRYAREIPFTTSITANDMDRKAVQAIKLNVHHNRLEQKITANTGNALAHMYSVAHPPVHSHGPDHVSGKYDVVDLDPYGTAAPFIDAALQAANDGGLLCVTCTDSGVFASCGYPEKTYSLYGGLPVKGLHSHEGGLRLILHSIATTAARYGIAIEPLLSLSIDFYARVFVRVRKSPADVKFLSGKVMLVYGCDAGCGAWSTQMLGRNVKQHGKKDIDFWKHSIAQAPSADRFCAHCGNKTHVAGPMWAGPLHNAAFVERILDDLEHADKEVYATKPRMEGMLDTALGELTVVEGAVDGVLTNRDGSREILPEAPAQTLDTHPFFFIPSALAKVLHCQAPPEVALKGALRHAGYRATRSHCKPGSVKTDAPWSAIWQIMRAWVRQKSPIKEGALKERSAGWKIMQSEEADEKAANGASTNGRVSEAEKSEIVIDSSGAALASKAKPADPKNMKVVFDEVLGRDKPGKRLVRYQQNPRENWGPMTRAK